MVIFNCGITRLNSAFIVVASVNVFNIGFNPLCMPEFSFCDLLSTDAASSIRCLNVNSCVKSSPPSSSSAAATTSSSSSNYKS